MTLEEANEKVTLALDVRGDAIQALVDAELGYTDALERECEECEKLNWEVREDAIQALIEADYEYSKALEVWSILDEAKTPKLDS